MDKGPSKEALALAKTLRNWADNSVMYNAKATDKAASQAAYSAKLRATAEWLESGGAERGEPGPHAPRAVGKAPELSADYSPDIYAPVAAAAKGA